jgi:outer membrane PBP1 activator LpoA protein
MKIVYFYQYFSTPKGSWGTRVYEFAKDWVDKGHEVTVVTSVYSKSDLKVDIFS